MPEWADEACRRWREMLDRLDDGAPDSVSTLLDWAIKLVLFRDRARRRGFAWESLHDLERRRHQARQGAGARVGRAADGGRDPAPSSGAVAGRGRPPDAASARAQPRLGAVRRLPGPAPRALRDRHTLRPARRQGALRRPRPRRCPGPSRPGRRQHRARHGEPARHRPRPYPRRTDPPPPRPHPPLPLRLARPVGLQRQTQARPQRPLPDKRRVDPLGAHGRRATNTTAPCSRTTSCRSQKTDAGIAAKKAQNAQNGNRTPRPISHLFLLRLMRLFAARSFPAFGVRWLATAFRHSREKAVASYRTPKRDAGGTPALPD